MQVGVLHPGEMGVTIAQSLADAGHQVLWHSTGRSEATRRRANSFIACDSLSELASRADYIVSICPPHAAKELADAVVALDFDGVYIDANAVSPRTATAIAANFGDRYVDGGVIGPPAHRPGTTRLYLSGHTAAAAAGLFNATHIEAHAIGVGLTAASSLKMAYAAYTKGHSALLLAVNALAEQAGVASALEEEWDRSQPGLVKRSEQTALATSRKAWRFIGEMQEIADTFAYHDLPDGFHLGAKQVYQRMAKLKDRDAARLEEVLRALSDDSKSR